MKTSFYRNDFIALAAAAFCVVPLAAAEIVPDLKSLAQSIGKRTDSNASVRWEKDVKGKPAFFARRAVWLESVDFKEGTIECDILGKSNPRGSNFPGIAFHGKDDSAFECVYFRPFNFRAENPENASHAVQYISHPEWTWQKLRAEKTGQYEKPIAPPPDGDAWFHAKIVVTGRKVSVFVNDALQPSLEVERLSPQTSGKIAIWGGDAGDGGYFANLKVTLKE
jgi:hypothetical protein